MVGAARFELATPVPKTGALPGCAMPDRSQALGPESTRIILIGGVAYKGLERPFLDPAPLPPGHRILNADAGAMSVVSACCAVTKGCCTTPRSPRRTNRPDRRAAYARCSRGCARSGAGPAVPASACGRPHRAALTPAAQHQHRHGQGLGRPQTSGQGGEIHRLDLRVELEFQPRLAISALVQHRMAVVVDCLLGPALQGFAARK